EFRGPGPERRGDALRGDQGLRHPISQVIAAPLGEDSPEGEARGRAHATGEILEAEAEAAAVEVVVGGAAEEGFELPEPLVLAAGVAEVIGGVEPGDDRLRGVHRE